MCPNGDWLFASDLFQRWYSSRTDLLWIHGPAGYGKSVLSTSIIEHLQRASGRPENILYFFYDFSDQTSGTLLRTAATLMHQLLLTKLDMPENLRRCYDQAQKLRCKQISELEATEGLQEIVKSSEHDLYIILDGLDESADSVKVAAFLRDLVESHQSNVKVIVLSRDILDVRSRFEDFPAISLNAAKNESDIHAYLSHSVPLILADRSSQEHDRIIAKLDQSAGGMFLWASLMVERLRLALCPSDIDTILGQPFPDVEEMYSKSLDQLAARPPAERSLARRLIHWVCCSRRPLDLMELQGAMAICPASGTFSVARKPFISILLRLCSVFFSIEPRTHTVRPIHASVHDFLTREPVDTVMSSPASDFLVSEKQSHQNIATECLILLQAAFEPCEGNTSDLLEPLVRYACLFWLEHALACDHSSAFGFKVAKFLESASRQRWILYFLLWQRQEFPLQRLLHLQTQLLEKLTLQDPSTTPTYMDWAFDVAAALLTLFSSRFPRQENSGQQTHGLNLADGRFSHFEVMMVIRDLSRHFTQTKTTQEAIDLFAGALAEERTAAEPHANSQTVVWLLNTLGILLDQRGETDQATEMQEEALSVLAHCKNSFNHDPLVIWTKNELGRMYRHQKSYASAETMHLDALSALESTITRDNSIALEISWTKSTLARVYRYQHRYDEAIAQSTAALTIRSKLLSQEHPHCAWLQSDIAQCHFGRRDYATAVALHRKVYEVRCRVLGPEHPDTLWTMNNLGVALAMTGADGAMEASALQAQVLESQERVLGREHPHSVWTREVVTAQKTQSGIDVVGVAPHASTTAVAAR